MDPTSTSVSSLIASGLASLPKPPPDHEHYFCAYTDHKATLPTRGSDLSLPRRVDIAPLLTDEREALIFLEQQGVIEPPRRCPSCNSKLHPMSRSLKSKSRFVLRCRSSKCVDPYCRSMFANTILADCKYSKHKFVEFCYLWLMGIKAGKIKAMLGMHDWTVTNWCNYLREAVASDILMGDDYMIGGPGITVEIDETKMGKRKYHVSIKSANGTLPVATASSNLRATLASRSRRDAVEAPALRRYDIALTVLWLLTERKAGGRVLGVWWLREAGAQF